MNNTAKSPALTSQRGFSLIELMVVVGIIGLLAAVAVPQFSKFQAKARQSEVKTNLAALFSAEKGFFSEYTAYSTDLRLVGFGAEGQNLRYEVGFAAAGCGLPATLGVTENGNNLLSIASAASITWYQNAAPAAGAGSSCVYGATPTFTAGGWGNPNSGPAIQPDIWTMNQAKALIQPPGGNGIN